MRVAIIGARGALGSLLAEHLRLAGHVVVPFSHSSSDEQTRLNVLTDGIDERFAAVDVVVYCAWSTTERTPESQRAHVDAADRWSESCRRLGARFLFTSTVLADPESRSQYGLHKLVAEQAVVANKGSALRIGLVADDAYPLLITSLRRAVRRLPAATALLDWPVLAVGSPSVCRAIEAEMTASIYGTVVWVAPRESTSLAAICAWGSTVRPVRSIGRRLTNELARRPWRSGEVGRHIDALAGLVQTCSTGHGCRDPLSGPISRTGWRDALHGFG